ncbi:MAG: hypothetical protein HOO67_07745 [Candidatus Peribacteraceae bacterium]|nr:hypothetical protein [Candidatus Peribacteraceae bacterium]
MPTCELCATSFSVSPQEKAVCDAKGFVTQPLCFVCRQKQRMAFRNGRKLYRRKCDFTGTEIISNYAPGPKGASLRAKPQPVYCSEAWYGDGWDALSYGRPFDFSRPFFEQFHELVSAVPRLALTNIRPENSDFCNMCEGNKNSYMVFGGDFNEDVLYGELCMRNRNAVDCDFSNDNEQCYETGSSFNCYGCRFTFDSKNCTGCAFISDCIGCHDCILCTNLAQKSFCIQNEQLTKEEYEKCKKDLLNGTWSRQENNWREFLTLLGKRIVKYAHILNAENCTGDYIHNSKNCRHCFDVWDCEEVTDTVLAVKGKNIVNSGFVGHQMELCYNIQTGIATYDSACCFSVFDSQNVDYCDWILNSQHCFGCASLNKKRHCILNTQYSETDYRDLRGKIIEHMKRTGEWGEFFPRTSSSFGYNESTANDYFPMQREQAVAEGFSWNDVPEEVSSVQKIIPAGKLPDAIGDVPDDILNWAIRCSVSDRPFRIVKQELDFYRAHRIPVPHEHPDERYRRRFSLKNPKKLWSRQCQKCGKAVETTYAPERTEKVYCDKCYLSEVY